MPSSKQSESAGLTAAALILTLFTGLISVVALLEKSKKSESARQEFETARDELAQKSQDLDQELDNFLREVENDASWTKDETRRHRQTYEKLKANADSYEAETLLIANRVDLYLREEEALRGEIQRLADASQILSQELGGSNLKRKERRHRRKELKRISTETGAQRLRLAHISTKRVELQGRRRHLLFLLENMRQELIRLEQALAPLESAQSRTEEFHSEVGEEVGARPRRKRTHRANGPSLPSFDDALAQQQIGGVTCCKKKRVGKLIVSASGLNFVSGSYERQFPRDEIRAVKLKKKKIIIHGKNKSTFVLKNVPVGRLEDLLEELGWRVE